MQKLGYLISQTRVRDVADFIEVTDDLSVWNSDKPTMIVGVDYAKKLVKDFSMLHRTSDNGKWWTFAKNDRRQDYERDLARFYSYVITSAVNSVKYYYVNIFKLRRDRIKKLIAIFYDPTLKYVYIYKNMLYLYQGEYVLGVSLNILKYIGINTDKHIKNMQKNKNIKIYFSDKGINDNLKQYAKNKRYLIPYFFSLLQ